jgi:hypothetical protein
MQIHRVPHGVAGYAERISLPSPNGHTTRRWPEISPRSANYQQFQEHSRKGLVTVEFDVGRGTPRRFGPMGRQSSWRATGCRTNTKGTYFLRVRL